jgi:hypothetical protein
MLGEEKDKSEKLSGREGGTFYIYPCNPIKDGAGNKGEYRYPLLHSKLSKNIYSTACTFDIHLYLTPLGQARQFIETCGT